MMVSGDMPDPVAFGRERRAAGDLHGALDAFQRALPDHADDPEFLFELAGLFRSLEMNAEALPIYDALAQALPDALPVLHNRAGCLTDLRRFDDAIREFVAMVARWGGAAPCWAGLGNAAYAAGRAPLGRTAYRVAIALEPERTASYANFAECLDVDGDHAEAVAVLRRAGALEPDDPSLHFNRARSLLALGDFAAGWAEFEWRRHPDRPNRVARTVGCPRWTGEPLGGRHLFVMGEQGIGDQIWFLPLVREVAERSGRVTLEVAPKLVPLVRQSLPGVAVQPLQVEKRDGRWHALGTSRSGPPDADYHIDVGSLPGLLWDAVAGRRHPPVLRPDADRVALWRTRLDALGPGPRIGICWRSPLTARGRGQHYLSLTDWAPILRVRPAQFICLQHGDCTEDVAQAHDALGIPVHVLAGLDLWDGVHDVAAVMASLDLVVSAATWISMLGGALGVRTLLVGNGRWVAPLAGRDPLHPSLEPVYPSLGRSWPHGVVSEVAERVRASV